MKVLLVTPNFYPRVGGVESHIIEILRGINGVAFSVLTNTRAGGERRHRLFPKVEFEDVWPADRELRKWFAVLPARLHARQAVASAIELLRHSNRMGWLGRLSPDLIHIHYMDLDQADRAAARLGFPSLIERRYSRIVSIAESRAPVLFTDHTLFTAPAEMVPEPTKQALLRVMKNIVSVDQGSFNRVQEYQEGRTGRSWFVPNSVDTRVFRPRPKKREGFHVGYAGRVGKAGQDIVRQVIHLLGTEVDWHVAIGGERYDLANEERSTVVPGVRLHQNLEYFAMPEFYGALDAFINPFPGEGVGRTTLEAMACGVPVIAVGSTDKYPVRTNETGYMVPADPQRIATTIRALAADQSLARRLGANARAIVEREFANEVLLPKLRGIYASFET